ncbi:PRC-barrel domain containing protein [Streptomyces mirabilis]|uniref:PRC-barrel domain containing protein n=1 Tax=Streptomyces mirabilis TaxID=68239 RepID=UPI00366A35D7
MRHLIVDTGVWVFGKSVLVPVGVVTDIDTQARKVTMARTREEMTSAPVFQTDRETLDPTYLARVGSYYRSLPPGQLA